MEQFQHKHYSPKICLDCRKAMEKEREKKYADRKNKNKWMDLWIGGN